MKYKIFLLLLVCIFTNDTFSQSKNAVFVEIAGNTNLYSLNYERGITEKIKARIGLGYVKTQSRMGRTRTSGTNLVEVGEHRVFYLPLLVNYTIGKNKNFLEVGTGVLLGHENHISFNEAQTIVNLTTFIGYRYEAEKGFLLRIGMTPHYNIVGDPSYIIDTFYYWGGLSLGYHF